MKKKKKKKIDQRKTWGRIKEIVKKRKTMKKNGNSMSAALITVDQEIHI